jgi:eukaryotic translation initiation factor 2-alpha kinase 4
MNTSRARWLSLVCIRSSYQRIYLASLFTSVVAKHDSHREAVLSSFFSQRSEAARPFVYYHEAQQREHDALNDIVEQKLASIFRLHGAVDKEPPLLVPSMGPDDQADSATLLDRQGEVIMLPNSGLVPFAQLAAQDGSTRIKRYHISNCYKPMYARSDLIIYVLILNSLSARSHPRTFKMAVFDMITPDLETGPFAAAAELITIVNECLNTFPGLDQNYEIHISHSKCKCKIMSMFRP